MENNKNQTGPPINAEERRSEQKNEEDVSEFVISSSPGPHPFSGDRRIEDRRSSALIGGQSLQTEWSKEDRDPLTDKVIGVFFSVFNELGHGFLESVYESAMMVSLHEVGLRCTRQVAVPVWFHGVLVGDFRADIIVEEKLIIELKAARAIEPIFEAQVLNYLRATQIETALLLNFGPKPIVRRFAFSNSRKNRRLSALIGGHYDLELCRSTNLPSLRVLKLSKKSASIGVNRRPINP